MTDDQVLWDTVLRVAPRAFPGVGDVVAIERASSKFASSYGADIITLTFRSGKILKLFLKDFKNAPPARRDREIYVYKHLLSKKALGTADYYGVFIDKLSGFYWLLIEYVPGLAIKHRGFDYWIEGARWLGLMQSYFEHCVDAITSKELLAHHDTVFYESIANAAFSAVLSTNAEWIPRIESVVDQYSTIITEIVSAPQTITHGDYKPIQIIINNDSEELRVCPVDWEKCAFGSIYYDLVTLTEGFDNAHLSILIDAFLSTAPLRPVGYAKIDVERGVNVLRLNAFLNRLRMSQSGKFPPASVSHLLDLTKRQADMVMAG